MNKLKCNELTALEAFKVKGGVFCEIYIGYTESTGQRQNQKTMNNMETLDNMLGI